MAVPLEQTPTDTLVKLWRRLPHADPFKLLMGDETPAGELGIKLARQLHERGKLKAPEISDYQRVKAAGHLAELNLPEENE